jgi:2-polyprenyl-3-methyl-5-hydroxy-6-metoxy-1,4-benzoquinol methylase
MGAAVEREIATGDRFTFGKNWRHFLAILNDDRIRAAQDSLLRMLDMADLQGKSFLDAGSGSGLFSLAARRLGARVHSFDYDPESVACARELRRRYCPDDPGWVIEEASVLDRDYLARLGRFDVVYSWGVLHHTGSMWPALESVAALVAPAGRLFIAIYNDAGASSDRWRAVKRFYNRMPKGTRFLVTVPAMVEGYWRRALRDLWRLRPFDTWRSYGGPRGMSPWYDMVDWVGGYPYEVATPQAITSFYLSRGFTLTRLQPSAGPLGCNEFVFTRLSGAS